jgi:NADH-ubiquinone oxidoreductase chain 5
MKVFNVVTYYIGLMLLFFSLFSIFLGIKYIIGLDVLFVEWEILTINRRRIIITFLFDWMSLIFMGLVLFISSIVIFYRTYYIRGDRFFYRFIILVYLFVLSIVFLILSPNIIRILLGWDGLGLVSYCLVIYYQNTKSANAGIITILSNRVGDVAILLRISWVLNFGSWNFFYLQHIYEKTEILFVLVIVILAAMTKRAQMPFSAWLPAAIAAPTPVSSLVHSSTLVTAGVYLLIRFNYTLGLNEVLFYLGVFTIFISGLGANFEIDLKKIIALSTLRQLGLIMITLSLGFFELSFFHLITHAMFKSLLFLCAGVFIHSIGDTQDIRLIGGLYISCPVTSFYFIGSSLALCGFPFLSGFYSKDLILEMYFMMSINVFIFLFIFLSTIFTLTYSVGWFILFFLTPWAIKLLYL